MILRHLQVSGSGGFFTTSASASATYSCMEFFAASTICASSFRFHIRNSAELIENFRMWKVIKCDSISQYGTFPLLLKIHDTQLQLCHSKESSAKDASSPLRNGLVDPDVIRQKLADHKLSHQSDATGESETLDQRRLAEELNQVKRENAVWKQQALTLRG